MPTRIDAATRRLEFIDRDAFTDAGQVRQASVAGHTVIKVNLDHDLHSELTIQLNDAIAEVKAGVREPPTYSPP